jgi:glycosyltransferase involved in cell wall biosynthesis
LKNEKIVNINNGIRVKDAEKYLSNKASIRDKYGINNDAIVFVSVGRLSHEKAYVKLLIEFLKVFAGNNNVHLIIAGDGEQKSKLHNIARNETNIHLIGYVEDPYEILCASDVYVCSSIYEGFSLAMVEAMNCGLPIVTTPVGIARDITSGLKCNILVDNIDMLGYVMQQTISNNCIKDAKYYNPSIVIEKYNIERQISELNNLYTTIIDHILKRES